MTNRPLLKIVPEYDYPEEFLVARLLGKKGGLFHDWDALISSSDVLQFLRDMPFFPYLKRYSQSGIWHFLRHEHLWVYSRMNNRLRNHFSSYFAYHEIKTLNICLRNLWRRKTPEHIMQELSNSLLHNDIQNILRSADDFSRILHELEKRLCVYSQHFAGLVAHFEKKGFTGMEAFLWERFFAAIFSQNKPLLMQRFFRTLIDFHNCMSVAKSLRWETEAELSMIAGGSVPVERLRRAYFSKDLITVLGFLKLNEPENAVSNLPKLETSFLHYITFKLKYWSYQRTVVAAILFYLWEQYRYTRNISMILNTVLLPEESVRESVVA